MKRKVLNSVLILLGVMFGTYGAAHALVFGAPIPAPEIDPGMAISALTILVGSLAVIHARRKK